MARIPVNLALVALLLAACERAPTLPAGPAPLAPPEGDGPSFLLSGDSLMWTDWSEYPPGSQPAGWTQMWDPTPHFAVADEPEAGSGRVLQWSATGQSRNRWGLAFDGLGDRTDQSVYTELRVRSLGGGTSVYYMGAAAVRMSGTAADERGYAVFFVVVPSTGAKAVVLSTWSGGAYVQLGSYTYDWQLDQWYSLRLEAVGSTIRARVWPRGTAEPGTWHLSATDSRYTTGRPGVSHHDNGTVQWEVWRAFSVPAAAPPPPTGPITFSTQFTGGQAWVAPAGWTETSAPDNSVWTVAADLGFTDGRALRNVNTVLGRHVLRLDAVPDTVRDQEVLVKLRMADADSRGPGVALRHSMSGSNATAYVAYFRPDLNQVEINRFLNGGWMFLNAAPFVNDPGAWYWMRFRAEGPALKVRVWPDGQAEPAAWTATASNTDIASGSPGLYTYEPNTVEYELASYASAGATAATPAPGSPPALAWVQVSPGSMNVPQGGTMQYSAFGQVDNGDSVGVAVNWSTTGGTVTSAGHYTAGQALGTFTVTGLHAGSGLRDVADVTIVQGPALSDSYTTGFTSSPVGEQPPYWTETSAASGVEWTVQADPSVPDGRVLRAATTTTGRHILRADGIPLSSTDQEVLARLRMADEDSRGPGVALRHTMSGSVETAYVAYFRPGLNQVEVNRFVAGAWGFVNAVPFVNDPGAWYWIRFRAEGTTLKVRVWADGAPEPSAWQLVATDTSIASGGVGVYTYEPNTVDFDGFSAIRGSWTAVTP